MLLKAFLKKYQELVMKFCAVIFAILSFYFAKTLSQKDPESMLFIESLLIISLCFYILYIITASIKLLKNYEKNLNFGFNLSIVFSDFLSNELFLFDLINNQLTIIPVNSIEGATSVKHFENDKVFLTTTSGFLHIIELKN